MSNKYTCSDVLAYQNSMFSFIIYYKQGDSYPYRKEPLSAEEAEHFHLDEIYPKRGIKKPTLSGEYKMHRGTHGDAVIINNFKFKDSRMNLYGYKQDERLLVDTFRYIGYRVHVYANCNSHIIEGIMRMFRDANHAEKDSFICCILSHGNEETIADSNGEEVNFLDLRDKMKGDECKTLANKPKIFFVQACRGNMPDTPVKVTPAGILNHNTDNEIPAKADFFIGYAVTFHQAAFVSGGGSLYVNELCKSLVQYANYASLNEIMTFTNQQVGKHCINFDKKQVKQAPVFSSTARKDIFFF